MPTPHSSLWGNGMSFLPILLFLLISSTSLCAHAQQQIKEDTAKNQENRGTFSGAYVAITVVSVIGVLAVAVAVVLFCCVLRKDPSQQKPTSSGSDGGEIGNEANDENNARQKSNTQQDPDGPATKKNKTPEPLDKDAVQQQQQQQQQPDGQTKNGNPEAPLGDDTRLESPGESFSTSSVGPQENPLAKSSNNSSRGGTAALADSTQPEQETAQPAIDDEEL